MKRSAETERCLDAVLDVSREHAEMEYRRRGLTVTVTNEEMRLLHAHKFYVLLELWDALCRDQRDALTIRFLEQETLAGMAAEGKTA